MRGLSALLILLSAVEIAAGPAYELENVFEKRRALSCTSYSSANKVLTNCQTNTAYCTRYLGRAPSTTTVFSSTSIKTVTPPVVTIKKTTTTKTATSTVFTKTTSVTAVIPTTTITSTISATKSDTNIVSVTDSETYTSTYTYTHTETSVATVTGGCTSAVVKRAQSSSSSSSAAPQTTIPPPNILVAPLPQCGMTQFGPKTISGACGCLIDKTTKTVTTTTTTLSRSLTTQTFPTATTTTISAVSTTTIPPSTTVTNIQFFTTTVATITAGTSTTTAFTTTVGWVSTFTYVTTTEVSTTTVGTTSQPRCTMGGSQVYEGQTYATFCNTRFRDMTVALVDALDFEDCVQSCQTFNDYTSPYSCVGVSFNFNQCNDNCELKQAINTRGTVIDQTSTWRSARLISPTYNLWGNICLNGENEFGDLYLGPGGKTGVFLCGMDHDGPNINLAPCSATENQDPYGGELECFDGCFRNNQCTAASFYQIAVNGQDYFGCCLKRSHRADQYYKPSNPADDIVLFTPNQSGGIN